MHGLLPQKPPEFLIQAPTLRSKQPDTQWRTLLQHLLTAWGMSSKRCFSRFQETTENIELAYGFGAIHQCLNAPAALATENKSSFGHHLAARPGNKRRTPGSSTAALDGQLYSITALNVGAGGACLKWEEASPGKMRIGELLAVRHGHRSGQGWDIAVIRWLKMRSDRSMEFGIQLLAPDAAPVAVRLCSEEESNHDYLKGLYLPQLKATRQPASLIVPAFLYHVKDIVSVRMEHREVRLRLVETLESNRIYSRFQFSSLA